MKLHKLGALAAVSLALLAGGVQAMPTLVGVPASSVTVGSSFTVILQDTDIADGFDASLGAYVADFLVNFDSSRLSLVATAITPDASLVAPGDWVPSIGPSGSPTALSVAGLLIPATPSGPLDLFSLEFTALADGVADFSISMPSTGAYGSGTAAYADVAASAAIQANTQQPNNLPEPQGLALLALAGLGAVASRKRSQTTSR